MNTIKRTTPLRNTSASPSLVMFNAVCEQVANLHNYIGALMDDHELSPSISDELQRRLLDISCNCELLFSRYAAVLGGQLAARAARRHG